jgi:hypothetical protein
MREAKSGTFTFANDAASIIDCNKIMNIDSTRFDLFKQFLRKLSAYLIFVHTRTLYVTGFDSI